VSADELPSRVTQIYSPAEHAENIKVQLGTAYLVSYIAAKYEHMSIARPV